MRSSYGMVVARQSKEVQAEAAWTAFRQSHIGLTHINRIRFAVGADDKVYAVSRREKTDHR